MSTQPPKSNFTARRKRGFPRTDVGNAEFFADQYKDLPPAGLSDEHHTLAGGGVVTNSVSPRFDWDNPTLCPPKMRAVLDRLAEGGHISHRTKLRDCIRGHRPTAGFLYSKNYDVDYFKIRDPLKLRCPWCLRPDNILHRRGGDFERLKYASRLVGADESKKNRRSRVWLLDWLGDGRPGWGEKISRLLGEKNASRHYPALDGFWGAELARLPSTESSTGARDCGAKMVNPFGPTVPRKLILFAAPEAALDYDRLREAIPSLVIRSFHGNLVLGWQKYLMEWAQSLWDASDQATADWMVSRDRTFLTLGRLRSTKEHIEILKQSERKQVQGDCQLITYGTRRQSYAEQEFITDRNLPKNFEKMEGKPLDYNTHEGIMSRARPQLMTHFPAEPEPEEPIFLTPKQIAQNSAELRELERQMLADDIAQRVVDKLKSSKQLSDLPETDYRQSKPLVQ